MKRKQEMAGFQGSRPFTMGACVILMAVLLVVPVKKVYAEPVRIAIDPGHGGTNLGAQSKGLTEKNLNMAVAEAMAEELRKYEGIEVYLTRTDDVELSLQQRADYAKAVGADFLFCLHFNMSEHHTLFGTEVWISAFGKYYAEGKSFGDLCLNELCTLDLYSRGVKTRLGKDGTDYYGIIKHCQEYGIPSAIIEHCHLDHEEDNGRYETAEALRQLGKLDAAAVAKYYGLYSPSLGVDYRKYEKPRVEIPAAVMKPDDTAPVNVSLTCLRTKPETGEVNILLTGEDSESGLLYYDYSLDGGKTYSGLQKWEAEGGELECTLEVPVDEDIALSCRVYNGYDLETETGVVEIAALQGKKDETEKNPQYTDNSKQGADETQGEAEGENVEASGEAIQIDMGRYEEQDAQKNRDQTLFDTSGISRFLWLAVLGFLVAILLLLIITRALYRRKQKKSRHRGRKR